MLNLTRLQIKKAGYTEALLFTLCHNYHLCDVDTYVLLKYEFYDTYRPLRAFRAITIFHVISRFIYIHVPSIYVVILISFCLHLLFFFTHCIKIVSHNFPKYYIYLTQRAHNVETMPIQR